MNKTSKNRLYQIIGKNIKGLREKSNLTQSDLAQKLDLSRTSIVNIEQGSQHPYIHLLWDISEIFDVDIISILPSKEEIKNGMQFDRTLIEESVGLKEDIEKFDTFINSI